MREFSTDKLQPQVIYLKTDKMKATEMSKYQPNTVIEEDCSYQSYEVRVTDISDRGDYYYVGYRPLDLKFGAFGYTRIYKEGTTKPPYGTIGFENVSNPDWMAISDNGDLACKCVDLKTAEHWASVKAEEEPEAGWIVERMC